jgi:hypothetical protein
MAGFPITCSTLIKNTGLSDCNVDVGFDVGHVFVPRGTEIDTEANAKLLATWQTLIQADVGTRIYPVPPSVKQEPTADEPVYETLSQGAEQYLYTNTNKDRFFISASILTPTFVSNMNSLNNGIWAAYAFTSNGFIRGKSIDGVKFLPMDCTVRIEPQRKATDAEGAHLPYTVRFDDYKDWNENGAIVDPVFNPSTDLEGLVNVNLAVSGTPTATELILVATTELNDIAVTGLVVADFLIKTAAGAEQAPSSVTESPTGTYTFVTSGQVTGTANLQLPSAMTTEGYEGVEVDFTV